MARRPTSPLDTKSSEMFPLHDTRPVRCQFVWKGEQCPLPACGTDRDQKAWCVEHQSPCDRDPERSAPANDRHFEHFRKSTNVVAYIADRRRPSVADDVEELAKDPKFHRREGETREQYRERMRDMTTGLLVKMRDRYKVMRD